MPTPKTRRCTRCNFSISEYAPGEKLCGACFDDEQHLHNWKKAVASGKTLLGCAEWGQHHPFKEPEVCEQCNAYGTMEFRTVSVNGKDAAAWICDDCGHAHLEPNHDGEDCLGC